VFVNGGKIDAYPRKGFLVGVGSNLRVVIIREAEDRRQRFGIVGRRTMDRVNYSEKDLEYLWRVVGVDDGEFRGLSVCRLWDREHVSEHRGYERRGEFMRVKSIPSRCA
jgi:hypothetical protein